MSLLNLDDLYKDQAKRKSGNNKVYEEILKLCHRRIKTVNTKLKLYECNYTIPSYVFGFPAYNVADVNRYLMTRLRKNGLLVWYLNENTIYISWKPEEIDYERYQKSLKKGSFSTKDDQTALIQIDDYIDSIPINTKKLKNS